MEALVKAKIVISEKTDDAEYRDIPVSAAIARRFGYRTNQKREFD